MKTLNQINDLNVVERSDGTYDIIKHEKILGNITFHGKYCRFEPQELLIYSDLKSISEIVLAIDVLLSSYITKSV